MNNKLTETSTQINFKDHGTIVFLVCVILILSTQQQSFCSSKSTNNSTKSINKPIVPSNRKLTARINVLERVSRLRFLLPNAKKVVRKKINVLRNLL